MTVTFFDKLVYRMRGRLPLVSAKLETMLVYTRGTGEPTPELALSRAPEPSAVVETTIPDGGRKVGNGRGGGGQGGEGGKGGEGAAGGDGGAGQEPGPGDLSSAVQARQLGRQRSTEAAPQPTLQITIGKLELHAAPPARKPEPARRQGQGLRLSDYLDRRR